jgi:hypothetical protein
MGNVRSILPRKSGCWHSESLQCSAPVERKTNEGREIIQKGKIWKKQNQMPVMGLSCGRIKTLTSDDFEMKTQLH